MIAGPGTIGLLAAQFAHAAGSEVHLLGLTKSSLALAARCGVQGAWTSGELPLLGWDAVIDATDDPGMPARLVELVQPGGRVVLIGISKQPSLLDTRRVARRELTVAGILGASAGLEPAMAGYAAHQVDPLPLVRSIIGLDQVAAVLAGRLPAGTGTKILVDPTRE